MSLLTDAVRAHIGRTVVYVAPAPLGREAIAAFAAAIGDNDPLYTDDEFARARGFPGVIAPPTLVCETNVFMDMPPDEHGYAGHMWDLPVADCRLIRGGNAYTFDRPVGPTDRVTVTWHLQDIAERTSSSGTQMLIVTSVATYTDEHGERLAENTETLIYEALP